MRKRRHPKTIRFFHRFFLGLGMVFRRFFKCFFISKCRQTFQSNIAKKLRKHWPWRQNQESAFSKILIFSIILVKNHHFLATSIWAGFWVRFGRVPQIHDFCSFGPIFSRQNSSHFLEGLKIDQKCEKAILSRPLRAGPAE